MIGPKFLFTRAAIFFSLALTLVQPVFGDLVGTKKVTVIALTDLHGALATDSLKTATGETVQVGGASLLASYIKAVKENTSDPVVIIDAGDLFQGTLLSNKFEGEPVIKFYNSLGVDASAVGNHEFDYGPVGGHSIPVLPSEDPQGAIKERSAQAAFPFLAVNMVSSEPDEKGEVGKVPSWAKASKVIERGGVRIGVIGAATPNTPATTVRKNLVGLSFLDPVDPILNEAKRLKSEENVDFIVLTMHEGVQCGIVLDGNPSCQDGDLEKMLAKFPKDSGIDLVIGGHSHKFFQGTIHDFPVVEAGAHGKAIGIARIEKASDSDAKLVLTELVNTCAQTVPGKTNQTCDPGAVKVSNGPVQQALFLGKEVAEDLATKELLASDFEKVAEIIARPLGAIAKSDFARSYYDESELGNLIVDLMRSSSTSPVDVSMTNNGGLRANLSAGPITYGSIYNILPFDNGLALVTVDGATLKQMIEIGINRKHNGLSWSGLTFTGTQCLVQNALVGGEPIDPSRTYRVLTNDYLAGGGSGFDALKLAASQVEIMDSLPPIRELIVEQISKMGGEFEIGNYFDKEQPRAKVLEICTK